MHIADHGARVLWDELRDYTYNHECILSRTFREALHESSGKWGLRIGMGCKAQTAATSPAIARICNAADRPSPQMHTARRFVQSFLRGMKGTRTILPIHFEEFMARRTKEDAAETRSRLIDAAELLFHEKGVSRTSLNDIAVAAGATRGAIYWHFQDKADLFNAMMDRVTLPLESSLCRVSTQASADPLEDVCGGMLQALQITMHDERVRRVFEVATHRVEYAGELMALRQRHLAVRNACVADLGEALQRAERHYGVTLPVPRKLAAQALHAIVAGLIENWLLDPQEFDLVETGRAALGSYLTGLGFSIKTKGQPAQGTRQ